MKKITDITGPIHDGMWNYEPPFPKFQLLPLPEVPWVKGKVYCEIFQGLHSQTGTYLETPAHYFGNENSYLITDLDLWNLYEKDCMVIHLEKYFDSGNNTAITKEMLQSIFDFVSIEPGIALLLSTGWGANWSKEYFLKNSPYIKKDAMDLLISKKPFLLGSDFPRWDNIHRTEGFFRDFYKADILMLAPCINLETINNGRCKLTVLPLNIPGTCCTPCRAIIIEESYYE